VLCTEGTLRLVLLVRVEGRLGGKMHERVGKPHDQP
jgi:hypothetical protein